MWRTHSCVTCRDSSGHAEEAGVGEVPTRHVRVRASHTLEDRPTVHGTRAGVNSKYYALPAVISYGGSSRGLGPTVEAAAHRYAPRSLDPRSEVPVPAPGTPQSEGRDGCPNREPGRADARLQHPLCRVDQSSLFRMG